MISTVAETAAENDTSLKKKNCLINLYLLTRKKPRNFLNTYTEFSDNSLTENNSEYGIVTLLLETSLVLQYLLLRCCLLLVLVPLLLTFTHSWSVLKCNHFEVISPFYCESTVVKDDSAEARIHKSRSLPFGWSRICA